jgi:putative membrane protein
LPIDRQREHQANERTFLAWLRTAIALIGFGLAIARFTLFLEELRLTVATAETVTRPLISGQIIGIALVVVGVVIIVLAVWRYNRVFWQIERGDYHPSRLLVWITAGIVLVLGLLSIPLVLWRSLPARNTPSSSENQQSHQHSSVFSMQRTGSKHPFIAAGNNALLMVARQLKL